MLRVAADCDEIPLSIINAVSDLGQQSKRQLRQRCEQFIALVADKAKLIEIVNKARSSSLPDFFAALVGASNPTNQSPAPPTKQASSQSLSASKLRYDAYDTPLPGPKLRNRDLSRSPRPTGVSLSDVGPGSLTRVSSRLSESSVDTLSKTLTPGELTLAASRQNLDLAVKVGSLFPSYLSLPLLAISKTGSSLKELPKDDLASRVDLITLDSPFVSDPSDVEIGDEANFDGVWNSSNDGDVRGWFNGSVAVAVKRLQTLEHVRLRVISVDLPPYLGDLKVIVLFAESAQAALRLRESDDDSCLWRLRCSERGLRDNIKEQIG
ncbi:hypothetical protein H0H87_007063 [Tephrocybe sp. NHM501043]|nr:hypothetical protein H0H87_007063 [Tephrocybe sp. NHM501043]